MNRKDFYFKQKVTEAELDSAFDDAENALKALVTDLGFSGVAYGLGVTQQGSPNLTVQVAAGGGYDQNGQRLAIGATQNLNCAVDENALNTAVITPGNEKWLSVFLEFTRTLSDPRTDGNSVTVYFQRNESFVLNVVAGAEAVAGTASRPALIGTQVLLADIKLAYGQTTITNANIDTTRRGWTFALAGTPYSVAADSAKAAITSVLSSLNTHVVTGGHPATAITYAGGANWADGTTNPATTVEAQLDKVVTDLNPTTTSASGARKIGTEALPNWLDGTTNPAGTLFAMLSGMVTALISTTTSASGARKIGIEALANWADGTANAAGSLYATIAGFVTSLTSTTTSSSGARKIGTEVSSAWADSTTVAAGTLYSFINGIVTALAGSTGTAKVGGAAYTGTGLTLAAASLQTQLRAIADSIATIPRIAVLGAQMALGNWTSQASGVSTELFAVCSGFPSSTNVQVIVGASGVILSSNDDTTWTSRTSGTAQNLYGVIWDQAAAVFIAVGAAGTILTSPDGTTWTSRTSGTANALYAVLMLGTTAVAVGAGGTIVTSTSPTTTWTGRTSGTANDLRALAYDGSSLMVAVGVSGTVVTTPDGTTWTLRSTGVTEQLNCVAALSGSTIKWIAAGVSGRILTSTNGTAWTAITIANVQTFRAIGGLNNSVVMLAGTDNTGYGCVWSSLDFGNTAGWFKSIGPITISGGVVSIWYFNVIGADGAGYNAVAVGNGGKIWKSLNAPMN